MSKSNGIWITPTEFFSFAEPRKNNLSDAIATREKATGFLSGFMSYLPDPDPILRKTGNDITVYREIQNDPHLGSVIESRKAGVLSLKWEIAQDKGSARHTKLITEIFSNLDIDAINTAILDAPLYGYQPLEIMWGRVGDYIVPVEIEAKPPEWFVFSQENELRFRSRNNIQGEELPDRKFLLARYEPSYINPYGKRVLSRCFWPVTFKRGGLRFWLKFVEKYGTPFLIGKVPRGTTEPEQDKLLDAMDQMVQDATAVIPDDSSIDTLEPAGRGSSSSLFLNFADFMNNEMSKTVLGQTLTTQMQDTGSYAATQSHMAVRKDIIDTDKRIVERSLNTLIKFFYEINLGAGPRCVFRMYEEEDVDKTLAERDETLTHVGVRFTKNYIKAAYGLEDKDFEITEPTPADPKQAQSGKPPASSKNPPSPLNRKDKGEVEDDDPDDDDESEFAETSPAEDELGRATESVTEDAQARQAEAEAMMKVIFSVAETSKSYEEFNEKIVKAYPEMADEAFMEQLEKTMFVSQLWGRLNADED